MSGRLFLDVATAADVPALLALEQGSYSHPWTEANFREAAGDPSRVSLLVLREVLGARKTPQSVVVAFCICEIVADEMHILDLVVGPEHRRQGLARWLLAYAFDRAARRGAERAFLEVRRSNEPALTLYRSLGFHVLSERRDYYREPGEDALVLEKTGLSGPVERDRKDP